MEEKVLNYKQEWVYSIKVAFITKYYYIEQNSALIIKYKILKKNTQ